VLRRLGDWSYALYLVHVPIVITVGVLTTGVNKLVVWPAMIVLALVGASLFGATDIALYTRLRRITDGWGWRTQAVTLTAFAALFIASMVLSHDQRREEKTFAQTASDDKLIIEALQRMGYHQDDQLAGQLESVVRAGGLTYLAGWVNDPHDILNRTSMLLSTGSTSTVSIPRSYKYDVIRAFGPAGHLAPTAFRKAIPDASCPPGLIVRTVAISRAYKTYRELNAATCPP